MCGAEIAAERMVSTCLSSTLVRGRAYRSPSTVGYTRTPNPTWPSERARPAWSRTLRVGVRGERVARPAVLPVGMSRDGVIRAVFPSTAITGWFAMWTVATSGPRFSDMNATTSARPSWCTGSLIALVP